MSARPVYLQGRGRGRGKVPGGRGVDGGGRGTGEGPGRGRVRDGSGRTHSQPPQSKGWAQGFHGVAASGRPTGAEKEDKSGHGGGTHPPKNNTPPKDSEESRQEAADKKFQEASTKFQEAARKHLGQGNQSQDSSDEDEDDISDTVLETIFKSYAGGSGPGELIDLSKAQGDLLHSFRSGASACLICIETIKKEDPIWNCVGCYGMFHIQCIQKWVKEGVYQQVYQSQEDVVEKDIPWYCPKCRYEYEQAQCPTRYYCFCGKEEDPKFDPWLVPHSCGQTCERRLKPDCGHECLLLCHPGACPPCPKTVQTMCHCGKRLPQTRRCSTRTWSCGQSCSHSLACGQHKCEASCHPGECSACPKTSLQKCQCGKDVQTRPCASPTWQCDKLCGKLLSCGHHTCERVCHAGSCGICIRAGVRHCPCGKTEYTLPCTEDIPTCVDTCGKELECGSHQCTQRCHTGPCGACRQMTVKRCRCGVRQKEVPCYKEFQCETKCSHLKDCKRHQCKRKCCDGQCPPCEQTCSKLLKCRNHKCASRCHRGPCYPCTTTVEIACNCKSSSFTVLCGREKNTKPPRCSQPCRIPPDCHHPQRESHRCHFKSCPPCRQMCRKHLPNCSHICPMVCHTAIRMKIQEKVAREGPWVPQPQARVETLEQPCAPCRVPIPISCLGQHETGKFPCSLVRPYACHKSCGRQLACGNHSCSLQCHVVEGAPNDEQSGRTCESCENQCVNPRPAGCQHKCLRPCHPANCPPCTQRIRMRCHCNAIVQHIECFRWNTASGEDRGQLQSCGGECNNALQCGHPCGAVCHAGMCPNSSQCQKKVYVRCNCRRKKKDFLCKEVQSGIAKLDCDDICQKEMKHKKKVEEEMEKSRREEEEKRQQAELEEYERKIVKGKKKKHRKPQEQVEEERFWDRNKRWLIISVAMAVIIGFAAYVLRM